MTDITDRKMAEKVAAYGPDLWRRTEKAVVLQLLDQSWKEHLLSLDHLRQGINLRAFGQKDPLNEYKTEAFGMFETMLDSLRESVTQTLAMVEVGAIDGQAALIMPGVGLDQETMTESRVDPAIEHAQQQQAQAAAGGNNVHDLAEKQAPMRNSSFNANDPATWAKVPRNAPCPCGSGKKFKHCHGALNQVSAR